jgi:hypothetical protein
MKPNEPTLLLPDEAEEDGEAEDEVPVADAELEVPPLIPDTVAVADAVLLAVTLTANFVAQAPSYKTGIARFVPVTLLYASLTNVSPLGLYFGHP